MATLAHPLTIEQFEILGLRNDRSYEFWYGEAKEKSAPSGIHGSLQSIIGNLLNQSGFHPAAELELRIESNARLIPDLVATRGTIPVGYPVEALEVAVEIVSEDESFAYLRDKCRKYQEWGFQYVYVVNPADRTVLEWKDGGHVPTSLLVDIPVDRIWVELRKYTGQ